MISLLLSALLAVPPTDLTLESKFLDELCDFKMTNTNESFKISSPNEKSQIPLNPLVDNIDDLWEDDILLIVGAPLEFVPLEGTDFVTTD